jgi:hypothetical protein
MSYHLEEPFAPERYLEAIKLLDIKKPTVLVKQHFLKLFFCFQNSSIVL